MRCEVEHNELFDGYQFKLGKGVTAYDEGADVGLVCTGYMIKTAKIAARNLKEKGITVRVDHHPSLKPFDRDIRENLEYAKRSIKERILPLYIESFFRYLKIVYSYIKAKNLVYIETFFFTFLIAICFLYIFSPYKRQTLKKYLIPGVLLFLIFLATAFSYRSYEKRHPKGIVVEKEIEVLSAPIAESDVLFVLYEGTKTKLLETRGEWLRISLADGREGWIFRQSIVFI